METPAAAVSRLVSALETLVEQEALQIEARDHAGVLGTQQRVAPLVEKLGQIGAAADADTRERVMSLILRRRQSQQHIAARLLYLRSELSRVGTARASLRRLAKDAPHYLGAAVRPSRRLLSAVS